MMTDWRGQINRYLTTPVSRALDAADSAHIDAATELRLRANKPAALFGAKALLWEGPMTPEGDIRAMADAMLGHAMHARQEELRSGFVTLPGGCRAGLCGRAVVQDGALASMRDISSIAIRVAREMKGVALPLMRLLEEDGRMLSSLIVSMPGFGKTTLLRDIARLLSDRHLSVSIVDERSELAACQRGVPTLDVGRNTDVLDGCPKADGMRTLLRAMAPDVIVTDELGGPEDAEAVREVGRCGVAVVTSAHGRNYEDLWKRPMLRAIMQTRLFERVVVLDQPGHVGAVHDGEGARLA